MDDSGSEKETGGPGSPSAEYSEVFRTLQEEEKVRSRTDEDGTRWFKIYFGGGSHFRNWLEQAEEIYGIENIRVEEVEMPGLKCYEEAGERIFRIWARK